MKYEELNIPRRDSSRLLTSTIRTISDIQSKRFCNRSKEADCFTTACEECLFSWYHIDTFKKWYRENKLKYRRLRIVASFE